ncbi:MAG TPA: glycoside hydrolase family 172 protein [Bacteroidales bacterium]|nr:glycoside hydrolase family 172 protein [Bacteroidales bacterium]
MKIHFSILVLSHVLLLSTLAQPSGNNNAIHSLSDELQTFLNVASLPEYRKNTVSGQVSTYDTTGKNDDGFNGTNSFIRRNADSSLVIFERYGSGVINRFWTPTPTFDTLDFYIDDNASPAFSIQYYDLFSGKKYPFIAPLCGNQLGGYYCYLPIPFEKSCKIVSRGKKMQFHQIQYRLYEKGTRVKSFSMGLNAEEKELLNRIEALWNQQDRNISSFYQAKLLQDSGRYTIKPGETKTVFELDRGGRILGIEMEPAEIFKGLTRQIDIRVTWDGETSPAIYCPVADFFGYAFGNESMRSLLLGSLNNRNYCYFPMPFDKSARVELIYRNNEKAELLPVDVFVKVAYSFEKRIPDKEGKFYIRWNRDLESKTGQSYVIADMPGRGHFVGTILFARGLKAGMTYFFEGDDSVAIDGSFRIHGTGSEDYFNGGWYAMLDRWDGSMSLPLHGSLDYSLPFCRTAGYRFYMSDKLSYEKSFYMSIEHGPAGNLVPVDYGSLALYYADTPPANSKRPTNELTGVSIPDTLVLYPQLMDFNIYGNIGVKTTWKYGTGGESYLLIPGDETWLRISLDDLPHGTYTMLLDVIKQPSGCDFSLWQRQTQLTNWISTFSETEERVEELSTGEIKLNGSINTITIRFRTGMQKKSLLLNRIIFIRKD